VIGSATPRMPGTIRGPLRVGLVHHHSSVNEENLRQLTCWCRESAGGSTSLLAVSGPRPAEVIDACRRRGNFSRVAWSRGCNTAAGGGQALNPPSIFHVMPVMNPASGLAR